MIASYVRYRLAVIILMLACLLPIAGCTLLGGLAQGFAFLSLAAQIPPGTPASRQIAGGPADRLIIARSDLPPGVTQLLLFFTPFDPSHPPETRERIIALNLETLAVTPLIDAPSRLGSSPRSDGRWLIDLDPANRALQVRDLDTGNQQLMLEGSLDPTTTELAAFDAGRIVLTTRTTPVGRSTLTVVDLMSGTQTPIDPPSSASAIISVGLSGDWLAFMSIPAADYASGASEPGDPRIEVVNLATGVRTTVAAGPNLLAIRDINPVYLVADSVILVEALGEPNDDSLMSGPFTGHLPFRGARQVMRFDIGSGETEVLLELPADVSATDGDFSKTIALVAVGDAGLLLKESESPIPLGSVGPPTSASATFRYVLHGFDGSRTTVAEFQRDLSRSSFPPPETPRFVGPFIVLSDGDTRDYIVFDTRSSTQQRLTPFAE